MDNDIVAGIVCVTVGYIGFVLILAAITAATTYISTRRRFRYYDGGCSHDPHTCASCLTAKWRHPSNRQR